MTQRRRANHHKLGLHVVCTKWNSGLDFNPFSNAGYKKKSVIKMSVGRFMLIGFDTKQTFLIYILIYFFNVCVFVFTGGGGGVYRRVPGRG